MSAVTATVHTGKNVHMTPFAIGQRVMIDAIDTKGIVKEISITAAAVDYRVSYFDDEKVRRSEWLDGSEISAL